jgi:hypothetical protein
MTASGVLLGLDCTSFPMLEGIPINKEMYLLKMSYDDSKNFMNWPASSVNPNLRKATE